MDASPDTIGTVAAELTARIAAWAEGAPLFATSIAIAVLLLVAMVADLIARRALLRAMRKFTHATRFTWDDALVEYRVFQRLARLVPASVMFFGIALVPNLPDTATAVVQNVAAAFMVLMLILAVGSALTAANAIYEKYPVSRDRPIKGYLQVVKIVVYVLGAVLVFANLVDRSPLLFLSGFGAMTAVLLLVFKDTILSLVASVQLGSNDMVRVGDWIEVPQFGADGDVVDIALHTVKVQNWDKTITTIPTHRLISDSFKNWRAMPLSGGRRIKRAVHIDTSSIRFLSEAEVEHFKRFRLLSAYVEEKKQSLEKHNQRIGGTANVNARRLTNIGTFRAYVLNYLKNHPQINQQMTLLVRQREPGPEGLPLEIYAFSSDTAWANYEGIQADIFDHILAIVPEFGLSLFQRPGGRDLRSLAEAGADTAVAGAAAAGPS